MGERADKLKHRNPHRHAPNRKVAALQQKTTPYRGTQATSPTDGCKRPLLEETRCVKSHGRRSNSRDKQTRHRPRIHGEPACKKSLHRSWSKVHQWSHFATSYLCHQSSARRIRNAHRIVSPRAVRMKKRSIASLLCPRSRPN